jgi:dTDP-4-amino-4,6-dideoxygalactose transaminase
MDDLGALAARHRLRIVEDAAQALGATVRGRPLGTIGDIGCISFHGTKNVTCGEGGVFVTADDTLADRAHTMREKGTNRRAFLEGRVDKYTWVERGSSFELSDLLAAVLLVQLSRVEAMQQARRMIAERYLLGLAPLAEAGTLRLPVQPPGATPNWHIFHVLLSSRAERDRVRRTLAEDGIDTAFHFVPLHSSPFAQSHLGCRAEDLPVTEDVAGRLLRLPIYPTLDTADQDRVIASLARILS